MLGAGMDGSLARPVVRDWIAALDRWLAPLLAPNPETGARSRNDDQALFDYLRELERTLNPVIARTLIGLSLDNTEQQFAALDAARRQQDGPTIQTSGNAT